MTTRRRMVEHRLDCIQLNAESILHLLGTIDREQDDPDLEQLDRVCTEIVDAYEALEIFAKY